MKNWHYRLTALLAMAALAAGCSTLLLDGIDCDEATPPVSDEFIIARGDLNFNFERAQTMVFIPVKTEIPEEEWNIETPEGEESWCKISRSYDNEKGLQLLVEESTEAQIRSAEMKVGGGSTEYTIKVRQLGYGPAILVNDMSIAAEGGNVELEITSNIDYIIGTPVLESTDEADWIEQTDRPATRAFAQKGYQYYAQSNMLPFTRKAKVAITAVDPMYYDASTECNIVQGTRNVTVEQMPTVMVQILSATASQDPTEGSIEALFDGDYSTYYHSPYSNYDSATEFPLVFEFKLSGQNDIDQIRIMHRAAYDEESGTLKSDGGHWNGQVGKFNIYYKNADMTEYELLTPVPLDFGERGSYQSAFFPSVAVKATDIKVEVLNGGNDFVTPAEVEFYAKMTEEYEQIIRKVFTDMSCSELNSGVTRSDITELYAIAPYLAQYVAVPMMDGTYLSEYEQQFRICSYKPYSNIDLNNKLLIKKYSRLDNPTGIEVREGDKLVVCVDQIPAGQYVALAVYGEMDNGFGPNYGGMSGGDNSDTVDQEVSLQQGYNAIDISANGMCYIINTPDQLSEASQSVKVHIAASCGTAHGYFDIERHTDADYMEILGRTTYKYFVAKGRNMIFNFHTGKLREVAPSGIISGLTAWDDIQGWQKELMGLDKITWFNNHVMAVSYSGSGYMDASNRRVNFQIETLEKIISREALLASDDNSWGPAHELGHVNQGAINWKSTSESSNNLFSNYARYKMGKYGSRGKSIYELADNFAKARPWVLLSSADYQGEDPEMHMRLNWQLWNYFHRCGVQPDFFPRLFENLRQDPLPSEFAWYFSMSEDAGASQLKYAEKVCETAGLDLTEFFEVWGFYRPVDIASYEQYGTVNYKVTEQMIAQSKARIEAMNLPKGPAIQYLEDRQSLSYSYIDEKNNSVTTQLVTAMGYYTTYQNQTKITKSPRYSINGRTCTVTDCDQAVAVEIRRAAGSGMGELLYFSNLTSFEVPATVNLNNVTLYAVQYDGERKAMSGN